MTRVLILVEGQTEERFVKDLLAPALLPKGIYLTPTILVTKRVKDGPNFKGGVTSYARCRGDLQRLLSGAGDAYVTTLLDYYGLPEDFPGMGDRSSFGKPLDRACHIEKAIREDFGHPKNFIPFLALHEFEALLYSCPSELPRAVIGTQNAAAFAAICEEFPNPEDINDRPEFAPSKRILQLFPGYRKTLHGPLVAERIGLAKIRGECPHFNSWLSFLEGLSSEDS